MIEAAAGLPDNPYGDVVVKTFLTDAVRTAILIDDKFPRFDQLCDIANYQELIKQYNEYDRAQTLYKMFYCRDIVCDIENAPNVDDVERLRKSDLIILDYHLTPGDPQDSSKSLAILKKLSNSPHFNVVTVYTRADLDETWET